MQGLPLGTLGTSGRRRELAGLSGGANLFPPAKAADSEPPVTSVSPHVARRRKRSLSSSSEPSSRCGSGRPGAAAGTRAGADGSSSPGSPCACWVRPVPCLSPRPAGPWSPALGASLLGGDSKQTHSRGSVGGGGASPACTRTRSLPRAPSPSRAIFSECVQSGGSSWGHAPLWAFGPRRSQLAAGFGASPGPRAVAPQSR